MVLYICLVVLDWMAWLVQISCNKEAGIRKPTRLGVGRAASELARLGVEKGEIDGGFARSGLIPIALNALVVLFPSRLALVVEDGLAVLVDHFPFD